MNAAHRTGLVYAMAANLLWGSFPVYFKQLDQVHPLLVIGHRMVWAVLFLSIGLSVARQWPAVRTVLHSKRDLGLLLLSTSLMGISWGLYIWAVHSDRIVEASLGYYMTPMMNVVVGLMMFRERLRPLQWIAVALAVAGVLVMIVGTGTVPWIGIILGAAFAIYSGIRKLIAVESLVGVFMEAIIIAPVGLYIVLTIGDSETAGLTTRDFAFLAGTGLITIIPICWYVAASRRLSLATLGTLFYLAPTIGFCFGVFLYDEPFTGLDAVMFGGIWAGLILFAFDGLRAEAPT